MIKDMCLLYYTLQAPALEVSSSFEEVYTFVSWSKHKMAKVSLFLHIITIYYLKLMIFSDVIVQLMTIVIKVRRPPCVTATDGMLHYNF